MSDAHDRSLSFGSQAAAYERGRPSYPPEAIDWLLAPGDQDRAGRRCGAAQRAAEEPGDQDRAGRRCGAAQRAAEEPGDQDRAPRDVLDLGAGTGKLTTRLVERGLDVVAVDPIAEMLEVLRSTLPDTPALLGTAEQIPLPDNSIDAVLVAQAWHWFDTDRAGAELARVLRPGGRLGLLWNVRDERLGWVKEFGRIVGLEHDWAGHSVELPEPFTDVQTRRVEWTNYITPQALVDYVASRSYCITSPADVRARTLDEVRELIATHPALANAEGIALPYVTVCIRATLG